MILYIDNLTLQTGDFPEQILLIHDCKKFLTLLLETYSCQLLQCSPEALRTTQTLDLKTTRILFAPYSNSSN